MASLARWCFRHRYLVILAWIAGLLVLGAVGGAAGNNYDNSLALSGTESTRALDLLKQSFPSVSGDSDTIVWHVSSGSVTDSAVQSRISAMLDEIGRTEHVIAVTSPYSAPGAAQVSQDGGTAYATVNFDAEWQDVPPATYKHVIDTARGASTTGLQVEMGGNGVEQTQLQPPTAQTAVAIIAAAVVLFIAFGSLLSTLVPLISAIMALGAGLSAIGLLTHAFSVSRVAPVLSALIGLGVGLDYALFIVTRHRNGLKAGKSPEEAAVSALNTAGRAVLFAGATVGVALLGLLILRVGLVTGLAIPATLAVLFTMAAAITLLPALLGVIGMRALSRKERRRLAAEGPHEPHAVGFWARWSALVEKRPAVLSVIALAVVIILAVPVFSVRLAASDPGTDPKGWTTYKAYGLLADGFGPGFNGPLQLVVKTPGGADDTSVVDAVAQKVKETPGVASVGTVIRNADGTVAILPVFPTTAPQDKATSDLIAHLRNDVIPAATSGSDVTVLVGGITAVFDDYSTVLDKNLPLFITVIVILGALLLLLAFRSLVIPLTAVVMNLLAAAATFGVVTAVFQWGWGDSFGLGKGPIEPSVPVLGFAVLFGLSMDYHVFLVSRMHEEWARTGDNHRAVRVGQAYTGRVITAAAAVMVLVFLSFALTGVRVIAEIGVALSTAVLLDAFVLRTVLVPAAMHMFGARNWWLPGWLDRIVPHLSIDAPGEASTPALESEPVPTPIA